MANALPNNTAALFEDFESSLSKAFLSFLAEARQSEEGMKEEKKEAPSLFLASACFDFVLFDGDFMKRPSYPFDLVAYLCSLSGESFHEEAPSLLCSLQRKEGSRIFLEGQKALFPSLCLETLQEAGMIRDEAMEGPLLESLYRFAQVNIAPLKERYRLFKDLCNVSLVTLEDGSRGKEKLLECASRIESELKEHSPWTKEEEREALARDILAISAYLNSRLDAQIREFTLDSTVSVEKELIEQAKRHLKMYNQPPWNANTEYGQWVYCFARLFASRDCINSLNEDEERRIQWKVMKEVFRDNQAMMEALGEIEGGEDYEMGVVDLSFIYAGFLFANKETFGIVSEKEIPIMTALMCNAGFIEERGAWGDKRLKEIYSFCVSRVAKTKEGPLFFDHLVAGSALASPKMRVFFGAALGSLALANYLNTGTLDFASLGKRAETFYKRLVLLSEGNLVLHDENDYIEEIMNDEGKEDRYANIAYFRTIAAKHLEELASPSKPNEA